MGGFSPRNLKYMRKFAENWPDPPIVQQPVAQLQWRSILMLLSKLKNTAEREWYAQKSLENGWSSNVLHHMIDLRLIEREGKAVTNFAGTLPPPDSDMAVHTFKDPYLFDFIGTAQMRREAEVERALVEHMEKFLLELGVADWQNQITGSLPDDIKSSLPTIEEIEREINDWSDGYDE